jgi:hypothetical protein
MSTQDIHPTVEGLAAWWNPVVGSGATGGELRFVMDAPQPLVIRVDEATRPTSVRWTVTGCPFLTDWVGTEPAFTITPIDDGNAMLELEHHGLTSDSSASKCAATAGCIS